MGVLLPLLFFAFQAGKERQKQKRPLPTSPRTLRVRGEELFFLRGVKDLASELTEETMT